MNIKNAGLMAALITFCSSSMAASTHWSYEGKHGSEHWGELSKEFTTCKAGVNQSPIDITGAIDSKLPNLSIDYKDSAVELIHNGHTVQANISGENTFSNDAGKFDLKQFHFHAPSENTIAGKSFPLESHFVHADENGRLAVIGVMFEEGEENKTLSKLWQKMPNTAGKTTSVSALFNSKDLMPVDGSYFRFNGSLTTPPCSEGVRWFVLKQPISAGKAQIDQFVNNMGGITNRPVQPLNARVILQ